MIIVQHHNSYIQLKVQIVMFFFFLANSNAKGPIMFCSNYTGLNLPLTQIYYVQHQYEY